MLRGVIEARADLVRVIEAITSAGADDAWASDVVDTTRPLFPRAHVALYSMSYSADFEIVDLLIASPPAVRAILDPMADVARGRGFDSWVPAHFSAPVVTHLEVARGAPPEVAEKMASVRRAQGFSDGIGIVAHPRPGVVTALCAIFDQPVILARHERELLVRISMHLEAGHRMRTDPGAVVGEIDARGRIDAPDGERLALHAAQITAARAKRRSPDASELWTALVDGRMSVVPRAERYVVVENAPSAHRLRALTPSEVAVLALAARGTSTKQIAYALGVSSSLVSIRLRSAAAKIGLISRTELVRVAALLAQDARGLLDDSALTAAEHEVLDLLERGYGNAEIARRRMRSVRTIANQVAAILRKTNKTSRRALIAALRPK